MVKTILKFSLLAIAAAAVLFGLIQLIPYGKNHSDPPVAQEPNWDSPETRALAVRACFDCHSNQTTWPWYSNIAPISWLVEHDVMDGRQRLNFSEWTGSNRRASESAQIVMEGEMPPFYYTWMHPSAVLSYTEQQALINGLQATFGSGGGFGGE